MTFKRTLHTYTEEDGVTFELKGEITEDKCTASVKGTINDKVTVEGSLDTAAENAEELLNKFFIESFNVHQQALADAFPDAVAV